MWHRGRWFVARLGPGLGGPKGTKRAEGLAHLWSHKALDYVRVNLCTPLDWKGVHVGGDRRGRAALSKAPAAKLRPERCAAQAKSFFFVCFFVKPCSFEIVHSNRQKAFSGSLKWY